jgi:threonine dehydratase
MPAPSDVVAAAERIAGDVVRTPAVRSPSLDERTGANVWLKLETRQRTGSFKDRGAANRMRQLSEAERKFGVIAMSAGNHAQAVAYQGTRLGIPTTIVMPQTTPFTKVRRTEQFGARVVLIGETLADCGDEMQRLARQGGLTVVHPYDDAAVIAGQGTAGLELLDDVATLETLLVPVGGGGLIAGIGLAAALRNPALEIIGVETEAYPSLYRVLNGLPPVAGSATIAEGIAVKTIGEIPLRVVREHVREVILVSEQSIENAIHLLLEEEKLLAEGAGAAGVAALLENRERFRGRNVGVIMTGGNIDTGLLANVIMRVRLVKGRVVRMRIEIADRPGILAEVAAIIGACGANILDVTHQRLFHDVSTKNAELDVTFEARSPSDVDRVAAKLREANFKATILESSAKSG